MLKPSTIQLLRFHFSFFLLPVYLFAIGSVDEPGIADSLLIFFILHLLVYPASNGYNSYMDKDEESIGGIQNPLPPTRQLFYITVLMDLLALCLALMVSLIFAAGLAAYILASRAYSYRGIRLKKYPFAGYLIVIIFQGAVIYFITYHGSSTVKTLDIPIVAMVASSLLVGGFYPLTQIYQHKADSRDGVRTISMVLGFRGTFIFTAIIYSLAMLILAQYFYRQQEEQKFFVLATVMLPVLVYFFFWAVKVWHNTDEANYRNTMRMNILASVCTNIAFLSLLILE